MDLAVEQVTIVRKVHLHYKYTKKGDHKAEYDIALLELQYPVDDIPFPIMKEPVQLKAGDYVTGLGWGLLDASNRTIPKVLRIVEELEVMPDYLTKENHMLYLLSLAESGSAQKLCEGMHA